MACSKPKFEVVLIPGSGAKAPEKGSNESAGWDLRSTETTMILPGKRAVVSTGLKFRTPKGYYGQIAPRSGIAVRNGIDVLAGVIDRDYTGEVQVVLINHGDKSFEIEPGDRIAQVILKKYCHDAEIMIIEELKETDRGKGGFGSTGVNEFQESISKIKSAWR